MSPAMTADEMLDEVEWLIKHGATELDLRAAFPKISPTSLERKAYRAGRKDLAVMIHATTVDQRTAA